MGRNGRQVQGGKKKKEKKFQCCCTSSTYPLELQSWISLTDAHLNVTFLSDISFGCVWTKTIIPHTYFKIKKTL